MKKKNTIKNMTVAAMIGGMGMAGYMYMKKNPEVMTNMKKMAKSAAKNTYEYLDKEV